MFLQAGYGHGHFVRQGSLLGARELPQAEQAAHAITGLLKLPFEPSMLWTADSIGRRGAHRAPVENVEEQCSSKANKRQTLFSPIVRLPVVSAFRVSAHRSQGLLLWTNSRFFQFLDACGLGVLSSLGPLGAPQSALLEIAVTPELEIIFDPAEKSRKFANIARDARVAFLIGWQGQPHGCSMKAWRGTLF
jgi:hypothetical protein